MLSVSGITLTSDKYRRKNSHSIILRSCLRTQACRSAYPSFVNQCFFKNEPIILCLTYFCFHWTVSSKKYFEEFDKSQHFRPVVKMGPKPRKTLVSVK